MLDWLAGFFGAFLPSIPGAIVNMVHLAARAITSWAGRIFASVGDAWNDLWNAHGGLLAGLEHFAWRVWRHLVAIVQRDLPWLYQAIVGLKRLLVRYVAWLWAHVRGLYLILVKIIRRTAADITSWVQRDIWAPLKRQADRIWHDLIQWGYTAWYYITHPDKLAALVGPALVAWLEGEAWSLGGKLGTFFVALFVRNLRRVALLVEDILHAAL